MPVTLDDWSPGSSPRMRGARGKMSRPNRTMRIIPADAGSTFVDWLKWSFREDHPRGCGEHSAPSCALSLIQGSSPRMRGAQYAGGEDLNTARIIPADAGSTRRTGLSVERFEDHPRGCGEHVDPGISLCSQTGSSPRMRGAPAPVSRSEGDCGIIPADAGSTCLFSASTTA